MAYIDIILISLFYASSSIENILKKDLRNTIAIYLQEYIKIHFVQNIRHKKYDNHITDVVSLISSKTGWNNKYVESYCIKEYYTFLLELFDTELIWINTNKNKNCLPYLELSVNNNTTTRLLIDDWSLNNTILNTPHILSIDLNRKNDNFMVDIMKKIVFNKHNIINNEWYFHSAICQKKDNNGYYVLLYSDGKYYIYDNEFIEIDTNNDIYKTKIKKECFFVIYRTI